MEDAVAHIAAHSSGHSEAIVTEDKAAAEYFTRRVDSAAVYVNVSTRFTDGGEFGLGCEMGISTQKLHPEVRWDWKNSAATNISSGETDRSAK